MSAGTTLLQSPVQHWADVRVLDSEPLSATNMLCDLGQVNQPLWVSLLIATDGR